MKSNHESRFGRYDVMLKPKEIKGGSNPAILMEFKVKNPKEEHSLKDTVDAALAQIQEKKYAVSLVEEGMEKERIYAYGFAFEGKEVLIGGGRIEG